MGSVRACVCVRETETDVEIHGDTGERVLVPPGFLAE